MHEAHEILSSLESDLVLLEQGGDPELLNRVFRCAHTLKGSSAVAGFDEVRGFMHSLEGVLDGLRSGMIAVDDRLTDLLLGSVDWVRLELFGGDDKIDTIGMKQELLDRIKGYRIEGSPPAADPEKEFTDVGYRYFRMRAKFRDDIFEFGINPLSIIDDFISMGSIVEMKVDDARLPELGSLNPEKCYLGWDVILKTKFPGEKLNEVFLFVRDDNKIELEDVSSRYIDEYGGKKITEDRKIGEILLRKGILARGELDEVLEEQGVTNRKIGDIIIEKGFATEKEIQCALAEQEGFRRRMETGTVRVDARKLDTLLNLLGEIVIGQSGIARIADEIPEIQGLRLKNALYGLDRTTREFQEQIMSIRMIPIGPTFNQFRRFIRDATRDLGKKIKLEIFGEETEIDKTMIEKISDPLKHMIRNALDHGIESPDEREGKGKSCEGLVRLNAYHQEGSVFIEITDDGRGIDRARIREKAVSLGLMKQDEEVSEERLFSFIFLPGFTTVEETSDLSGRGVGMDVVKTNIEAMRGTVTVETLEGIGTTFQIKLPLTLAIIEGMLVRIGENIYIIPLLSIAECLQPKRDDVATVEGKGELLHVRGRYIPLIRLHDLFGIKSDCANPWESLVVVVESEEEAVGIMVDELVGQQQIVIKSLNGNISKTRAVSGAAILGDGMVALILDIHGLVGEMTTSQRN